MSRTVKVTVSRSTNPSVDGDWFIDVRDTTGGRNRQMTTRTRHTRGALRFIEDLKAEGARQGVEVTVVNEARSYPDSPGFPY